MTDYESFAGVPMILPLKCQTSRVWHMFIREFGFTHYMFTVWIILYPLFWLMLISRLLFRKSIICSLVFTGVFNRLKMFGCVLAGQPVLTNFERLTETDFVLRLAHFEPSFLTIFLTSEPLPDGLAAAIYISLPSDANQGEHWNYVGFISNQKPSGTFKVTNLKRLAVLNMQQNNFGNFTGPQVGLTIKPLSEVEQFTPGTEIFFIEWHHYSRGTL